MTHVCTGCLVSPRHILSSAGCIKNLFKSENNVTYVLTAFINQIHHKILQALYHKTYDKVHHKNYRSYDIGMALVCIANN